MSARQHVCAVPVLVHPKPSLSDAICLNISPWDCGEDQCLVAKVEMLTVTQIFNKGQIKSIRFNFMLRPSHFLVFTFDF